MKNYLEAFQTFLKENEPQFGCNQMGSLLGMLYCCYSQSNQMETKKMQQMFGTLDDILNKLPIKEHDQVIDVTIGLCAEQQRKAFIDGIMIGFRLYSELYLTEKTPSAEADGAI